MHLFNHFLTKIGSYSSPGKETKWMQMKRPDHQRDNTKSIIAEKVQESAIIFGNKKAAGLKHIAGGNFLNKVLYFECRMNSFL